MNITRAQLAEIINIQYHTLAKYETGDREPNFNTLIELSKALGVSTDYLLGLSPIPGLSKFWSKEEELLLHHFLSLSKPAQERVLCQVQFEYEQQSRKQK